MHDEGDIDLGNECSSESEDDLNDESLQVELARWANEFLGKHNAVDSLLSLLKKNGHQNLPSSTRTLLGTTRSISVQVKSGMDYIYLPLAAELFKHFKRHPPNMVDRIDSLEISLNVDGMLKLYFIDHVILALLVCTKEIHGGQL